MRTDELKLAYSNYGPEVMAAIDAGVDVSLLLENLALTPTQRIEQLQSVVSFFEDLQRATGRLHDSIR